MKTRIYLDTSILGGLTDPGPKDRIDATTNLLAAISRYKYESFISSLVLQEVDAASQEIQSIIKSQISVLPLSILEETDECLMLSKVYVNEGVIPARYKDDARHLAIATIYDVSTIISWNFRHLVNINCKRKVNSINLREGYPLLEIVSPFEVVNEE